MKFAKHFTVAALAFCAAATSASGEERVTYKSAKSGSSYYQMGVEISEAVKAGTDGDIIVTIEESQGSVQNVMEVRARGADYVFTTPPSLVGLAQEGKAMFEGKGDPAFDEIRALFPIPSLTMHFVMSEDSGVTDFAGMEGQTILLGAGSFGATEGEKYLEMFGLTDKVTLADAELSNAVAALKNGQIDGFVTAGSYPAPNVIEAAASMDVNILSLSDEQVAETGRTRLVDPGGHLCRSGERHRDDLAARRRVHDHEDERRHGLRADEDLLAAARQDGGIRALVGGCRCRTDGYGGRAVPSRCGAVL